jgi:indolepyruvate ferredoxin oxidoreductase
VKFLTDYQNAAYAQRYQSLVEKVRKVEGERVNSSKLAEAVARYYHKLLAYKDEYEVARLHANGEFEKKIAGMFEGGYRTVFYLAPPLLARTDPLTGEPRKIRFGSWILPAFKVLKTFKFLRGTVLDPFGHTAERRMERALIAEYEHSVERLLAALDAQNHALAVQIASVPEDMRGFGYIKKRNVDAARKKRDELLARFRALPAPERVAA